MNDREVIHLSVLYSLSGPLARARRWRKESLNSRFADWWKKHPKPRHLRRQLDTPKPWVKSKIYKGLNRVSIGRVLAARWAHGDFADYHERFGHDTELTCQCGRRRSPVHTWTCTKRSFSLSENFVTKLLPTDKGMAYLAKSLHKGRH